MPMRPPGVPGRSVEALTVLLQLSRLMAEDVQVRLVSVPSTNLFSAQSDEYRDTILTPVVPLLLIEAGISLGWRSFVGPQVAVIGVDTFGADQLNPADDYPDFLIPLAGAVAALEVERGIALCGSVVGASTAAAKKEAA